MPNVKIKILVNGEGLPLPKYGTTHSAGMDLMAAVDEDVVLKPMDRTLIPTGIAIALPDGYEAQIRPRSGLAIKNGISILNSPGTIDADYRGEIKVIVINLGSEDFTITRGMRISQMIIAPFTQIEWEKVDDLEATERNEGGFGSTGH